MLTVLLLLFYASKVNLFILQLNKPWSWTFDDQCLPIKFELNLYCHNIHTPVYHHCDLMVLKCDLRMGKARDGSTVVTTLYSKAAWIESPLRELLRPESFPHQRASHTWDQMQALSKNPLAHKLVYCTQVWMNECFKPFLLDTWVIDFNLPWKNSAQRDSDSYF